MSANGTTPTTPVRIRHLIGPEQLTTAIGHAKLEVLQLGGGGESLIESIVCPDCSFSYSLLGPPLFFRGEVAADAYTLCFVTNSPEPSHSFNFATTHTDSYMGIFPLSGELCATTCGNFGNAALTVSRKLLEEAVESCFPGFPQSLLMHGGARRISPSAALKLQQFINVLLKTFDSPGSLLGHRPACRELQAELIGAYLTAILNDGSEDAPKRGGLRFTRRYQVLRKALEIIENSYAAELSMQVLCQELAYSQRGLEYLFQDLLGVSPRALIKAVRLHAARAQLITAEPHPGSVKLAVLDAGFWHLGHFAASYRELFGELPVQTLDCPA